MVVNYYNSIYSSQTFPFTFDACKEVYPLFFSDDSKQQERVKSSPIDIRMQTFFK